VVVCLERGADLHMAQLMPLLLTVSCFNKIQIGFTFLVLAHLGSPGKRAVKRVCVCVVHAMRTVHSLTRFALSLWHIPSFDANLSHHPNMCSGWNLRRAIMLYVNAAYSIQTSDRLDLHCKCFFHDKNN